VADRVPGRVILVGGGPGADDLITMRGLDRLMAADVVITDRLAPVTLLSRLGPEVERSSTPDGRQGGPPCPTTRSPA
jgi:siroheme synthase